MSDENIDLVFKALFFPSDEDGSLDKSLYTDINRVNDAVPDPVAQWLEKTSLSRELSKSGDWDWNEPISTTAPLEKRESDDDGDLSKLWKSIVRTEKVQDRETGEWWSNGYDAAGTLIDARILIGADAA